MTVVVDASAVLAWQFDEHPERTPQIREVLRGHMLAPALWPTEIAHGLALLDVECVASPGVEPIDRLAARTGLTAYDAEYLHLALDRGVGLLTCGRQLATVAVREGIALVPGSVAP